MEIKQLNEILKNLVYPDTKILKFVKEEKGYQGVPEDTDGPQGEYNEIFRIYQIVDDPEMYMKVTLHTNSYGYDEFPIGVSLVKAIEKKITVYDYE